MRLPLFVVGVLLALNVLAATPEDTVRGAVAAIAPNVKIDSVRESVVPGFYEVMAGGQLLYVSTDGRYMINGSAYDVANKRDLTAAAQAQARKIALDKIGPDKRIVFAPKAPIATKHTVTVFTDVDCPFCRRFHEQIAAYNAKGIAVDYLFFPLSIHPGADKKAEAVWCSKDRASAFTAAMSGADPGHAVCSNPIPELTQFAISLGIGGTPTILADDGSTVSTQIAASPDQFAAELDRLAQANAAKN